MTVVGRTGHMDGEKYVPETVTVRVEDEGGWAVEANDVDEKKAEALGRKKIDEAKAEMREQIKARVAAGFMQPEEAAKLHKEANL